MILCILMRNFFGDRQQAAIAPNKLTMILPKHLCLEYSTCAMFLSSSFTGYIKQQQPESQKRIIISITSAFDIVESRWYFLFPLGFSVYFAVIASKKLAEVVCHTKYFSNFVRGHHNDFVCKHLHIRFLKLQQTSLVTKTVDIYNPSNSH